jgi:glucosamine-6-phosphate deaminase
MRSFETPMAAPVDPLAVATQDLGRGSPIGFDVVPDDKSLTVRFAETLMHEYDAAKEAGRDKVVFIVPVGPIGQFDLWADQCNATGTSLTDLVLINMDEYLLGENGSFIPKSDPLSFRAHMDRTFYGRLDPKLAPPEGARVFPDPRKPEALGELIDALGGADVCFGGVGITGHLAFNDPPEPGEKTDADSFAALPTRVVKLSRETRLINAVTAARGNIDRIPEFAVTVGMREILESRKVRIFMNRLWQCAIVRKLLHGPVTAAVPASLLQRHADAHVTATEAVTLLPQPQLR